MNKKAFLIAAMIATSAVAIGCASTGYTTDAGSPEARASTSPGVYVRVDDRSKRDVTEGVAQ